MPVHDPYDPDVILYSDPFEDAAENLDSGTVKGVARLEVHSQLNPVSIPFQPKKAGLSSKEEVCPACAGSKRPTELDEKIGSCTACRRSFSQHGVERESRVSMFDPSFLYGNVWMFCTAVMNVSILLTRRACFEMTARKRRITPHNQDRHGRLHHCRVKLEGLEQLDMGMGGVSKSLLPDFLSWSDCSGLHQGLTCVTQDSRHG